jgi:hypothetical protein
MNAMSQPTSSTPQDILVHDMADPVLTPTIEAITGQTLAVDGGFTISG